MKQAIIIGVIHVSLTSAQTPPLSHSLLDVFCYLFECIQSHLLRQQDVHLA